MLIVWDVLLGCMRGTAPAVLRSGLYLVALSLVVEGCATRSLIPAAQSEAIKHRERALASHADAIHAAVAQSGQLGALAFLDARDGHLVVLPGDTPTDAWARYATPAEGDTSSVSMPAVVTFVYRADIPKAPETVTQSDLRQQQRQRTSMAALAIELGRLEEKLGVMQRELTATRQDTDKAVADMRTLAEDLDTARKFMLQTAQLGWLNHELVQENASGIRRMATASQELTSSSARLEETLRHLSERLAGQLNELASRLDAIQSKIQNIK